MALKSPIHPDVDYMTPTEMRIFKEMRESGKLSVFRCGACQECDKEIPKPKVYCSIECKQISEGEQEDD